MVFSHRGLQSLMGPGQRHRHRGASSVATLCPVQSLGPINTSHSLRGGGGRVRPARGTRHGRARWAGRPGYMCRFMCSARWSEREKARSQRWHWNGRWPVCLR